MNCLEHETTFITEKRRKSEESGGGGGWGWGLWGVLGCGVGGVGVFLCGVGGFGVFGAVNTATVSSFPKKVKRKERTLQFNGFQWERAFHKPRLFWSFVARGGNKRPTQWQEDC